MSELLNIWREIGSYNRFGETKNVILLGLLAGLLGVMTRDHSSHVVFTVLFGGNSTILLVSFLVSLLTCLVSFLPVLHYPSILLGEMQKSERKSNNPYYFYDIAESTNSAEWLATLSLNLPEAEKDRASKLAQQIWIISRIARRKFLLFRVAVTIVAAGWAISWAYVFFGQS